MVRAAALMLANAAVCATLTAPGHAFAQGTPSVDFRGARLGMAVEEFKSITPPPQLLPADARASCSTDPADGMSASLWSSRISPADKALGVVACAYRTSPPIPIPAGMKIGSSEITGATYYFFNGRLYDIELVAIDDALTPFVEGLTEKFGPPTNRDEGEVRNGVGNTFPQVRLTWSLTGARVVVRSPDLRADRMTVEYLDVDAARKLDDARKARDPDASKL